MADGTDQTFWVDGEPYKYVPSTADSTGGANTYWINGAPSEFLATPPASPANPVLEVTGMQQKNFMALFF